MPPSSVHARVNGGCNLRHWVLLAINGCLLIAVCAQHSVAQLPNVLKAPETPAAAVKETPERSLEEWRTDLAQRLAEVESEIKQAKTDESKPSSSMSRRLESLARVDLLLTELEAERSKAQKLQEVLKQSKQELDQLVQQGMPDDAETSIRRLDEVKKELQAERRRLDRVVEKEMAAVAALEAAQESLKDRSTARRQAREKSDNNKDNQLRQELGERLAEALEQNEIAEAVAKLRAQELLNAKMARESQEHKVRLLEETENRLKVVAKFGPEELASLFEELDRQENDLQKQLSSFEIVAEPRIRSVEEQWISARRELDAATSDKSEVQARIKTFELEYQVLRTIPSLLRLQIERLAEDRKVWQHRQKSFRTRPNAKIVADWTRKSTDALAQLKRDERKEAFELAELREQIDAAEARQEEAADNSVEASEIKKQISSLRDLRKHHESSLSSIQNSKWLHEQLLDELKGNTLAATAKDQLQAVWNGVLAVWNFELTKFGEGSEEKSVTVRKVVTALLVLMAGLILSRALSRTLGRQLLRRLDIDPSASATIQSLFYYLLLVMFSLFALNVAKVPLTAFTVLGGAVALGVGFGSQNIINNFISGLILLAERPVKVGDLIQLEHSNGERIFGNIEHIGARSTRVRTGSNLEIIVPNSSFLQNNVINFTLSNDKFRTMVEVGVVYGSPTVTVTQLLRRAVIETGRVAKDPPPIILFKSFGDNSLVFQVHFWLRMRTMMDQMQIESAVRFRIDQLFREEGIVIAFPQRDLHLDTASPLEVRLTSTEIEMKK